MTIDRALRAAAGLALVGSLFLVWFEGIDVDGWEHLAWADVALVAVAAALPLAPRIVAAALCGLGIAVVLGHGFEPDEPLQVVLQIGPGPYVCLAALAAGAIVALWRWPAVLLVAAAAGLVAALLSGWGGEGSPDGFERWRFLDVGLLLLAAGMLVVAALLVVAAGRFVAATGRAPVVLRALLGAASLAAAACIVVAGRSQLWIDEGLAEGPAMGTVVALLALGAGVAGLALVGARPREPAGRAG